MYLISFTPFGNWPISEDRFCETDKQVADRYMEAALAWTSRIYMLSWTNNLQGHRTDRYCKHAVISVVYDIW